MCSSWHARSNLARACLPALLFAVALGFRLRGLGFGLPMWSNFYIRPDESLLVVPAAEMLALRGDPGHLHYPALMIEALAIVFRFVHGIALLAGDGSAGFLDDFGANPSRYFLAGRLLSAVCGAALAYVVYRLSTRWVFPLPAAIVALWYAVSPLAVREAHFAVTDIPMSLLVACSLLVAARSFEGDAATATRSAAWCGCVAGMAVATKYSAGIMLPAIAVALLWAPGESRPTERYRRVMVFLTVAAGVFLLLNPRVVLHPAQFLEWMQTIFGAIYAERSGTAVGYSAAGSLVGARVYLGFGPGRWVGLALGAAGLVVALARCRRTGDGRLIALSAATLGWVALIAPARTLPFRYLSPLLPLVAVCAAIGMEAVVRSVPRRLQTILLLIVGVVGIATTVPGTHRLVGSLAREDTRSEAGRWIRANVPPSVPIVWLGEPESEPQVLESTASLRRRMAYVEERYGLASARVINRLYLLLMRAPSARDPSAHEVHRGPNPSEVTAETVCIVHAAYPLPVVRTDERLLVAWMRGRIVRQVEIGPVMGNGRPLLDLSDAFFLPLDPMVVLQPGPRLSLFLVERDAAPGGGS